MDGPNKENETGKKKKKRRAKLCEIYAINLETITTNEICMRKKKKHTHKFYMKMKMKYIERKMSKAKRVTTKKKHKLDGNEIRNI